MGSGAVRCDEGDHSEEEVYRGGLVGKLMPTVQNNDETVLPHKEVLFQATFPTRFISEKSIFSFFRLVLAKTSWFACFGQMGKVYP